MSNIVGEPFNKYVTGQILARQLIHGKEKRDNQTLVYLNSNTPWIKLTSGVRISDNERLKRIGLDYAGFGGTYLAKQFILFGGTYDSTNTFSDKVLNSGIIDTTGNNNFSQYNNAIQSILNKVTYGLGGTEFGLRPMPGILSCETKFRNRGSIRDGVVQIKAHSREQFEIIQLLYLRIGFPILLEYGHSVTLQNDGTVNSNPNFSISPDFLNEKFKNDNEVLDALELKRKESEGNYDAMYGRVQNFDWTFDKNGSYNITLKIISIGAVVESLKVNVLTDKLTAPKSTESKSDEDEQTQNTTFDWVVKYKYSHNIGNFFFQFLSNNGFLDNFKNYVQSKVAGGGFIGLAFKLTNFDTLINDINNNNAKITSGKPIIFYKNKDGVTNFIQQTAKSRYYVRLGHLLGFIQNSIIPNNLDKKTDPKPILNIDFNSNTNFMYTEEQQLSSDPRICFVGGFKINRSGNQFEDIFLQELKDTPFKSKVNNVLVGFPMNIFVEFSIILNKIDSLKDENGNTQLAPFINAILEDINKALGNINHLELVVNENNVAKIIDSTPIPGIEKLINNPDLSEDSPEFNVFGYYNNGKPDQSAGFIKDFGIKTEMTNQLASLVTIGATANGAIVGEDATAFSKWNNGLEPIINKNINYPATKDPDPKDSVSTLVSKLEGENSQLIQAFYQYVNEYKNVTFKEDNLDGNVDLVSNYLAFKKQETNLINKQNKKSIASSTSSKGFLPINLQLTFDGLSGIKIYQKIKVDTSFLPSDYPTSLKFIIKGVNNKVDKSGWDTSIETVSVPVIEAIEDINKANQTQQNQTTMAAPTTPQPERADSRNNKNAQKLRETLTKLGYKEKGQEIDNGGQDISANIEKATSAVLNTIKQELPNIKVTVTGGNDKYHQGLSYVSRHKQGNAVDFVIAPVTTANLDAVVKILQRYAAGNSPNFRFIDEYRHLTKAGTGNHFHMSYGAGTEGQTSLNESLKLAQEGKITPIKIV